MERESSNGKSSGNKVIMAKLPREEFVRLQKHCELKKETVNSVIRKAVMNELDESIPHMLAGKNVFSYNRNKDNFTWSVMLDNGHRVDVEDDLPASSAVQLLEALKTAVEERNVYIRKEEKETIPMPSKIMRKKI